MNLTECGHCKLNVWYICLSIKLKIIGEHEEGVKCSRMVFHVVSVLLSADAGHQFTWNNFCFSLILLSTCLRALVVSVRFDKCRSP